MFFSIAHYHHRLRAHLHAAARGGAVIQTDGVDRGIRAAGLADLFDADRAGDLAASAFGKNVTEWRNPLMTAITSGYRASLKKAIRFRWITVAVAAAALGASAFLLFSGVIGSEFLPHLDEGAIWVRGTLAPSTGPTEGARVMNQARVLLASFPEVTQVVSQVGRPDDGTDIAGFFNTEYFVDLKPKEQWRPVFHQNKEALIASMDAVLEKIPGALWNFSQPIADNMEEAVSGVKGQLAIKIYGDDLKTLEAKGDQIVNVMKNHSRDRGSRAFPRHRPTQSGIYGRPGSRRRATG